MKLVLAVGVLVFATASLAFAQDQPQPSQGNSIASTRTPGVAKRQIRQRARINQGVRSGELTRGEAARLRREERHIQRDKQVAKADGKVTPAERRHLQREENRASRHIYGLKHNNRVRAH